jgi:hypothetical protein
MLSSLKSKKKGSTQRAATVRKVDVLRNTVNATKVELPALIYASVTAARTVMKVC